MAFLTPWGAKIISTKLLLLQGVMGYAAESVCRLGEDFVPSVLVNGQCVLFKGQWDHCRKAEYTRKVSLERSLTPYAVFCGAVAVRWAVDKRMWYNIYDSDRYRRVFRTRNRTIVLPPSSRTAGFCDHPKILGSDGCTVNECQGFLRRRIEP